MKPPFSFEKFLGMCEGILSEEDIEVIKAPPGQKSNQPALKKWQEFDAALRNALVRIRAARKHKDPAEYLRRDGYEEPFIAGLAMNAHKNPSILKSERMLDEERWKALDEIGVGHYFDIDTLIVYAQKLSILDRWQRINTSDASVMLEEAL